MNKRVDHLLEKLLRDSAQFVEDPAKREVLNLRVLEISRAQYTGQVTRTEPNKEQNEQAIAELKRETRGEKPLKYKDARIGRARTAYIECYSVRAVDEYGQDVQVALFPYDDFDDGLRRETARMMAEELAESINKA